MLRDPDCGRQPVGARSHHDGIIFIPLLHVWSFSLECQPKEITQKPSILVGSLLRLLLVPVDRKDQKCTYARSIRQQCLPGSIQAGIKFGRVFGQLINASSRGSWWRWRGNNLGRWRVDMAEFGMTRVRIGLFQHALATQKQTVNGLKVSKRS
jgi:hypothetical protein